MTEKELHDWLQLATAHGVGNTAIRRLLTRFGLPSEVLAQTTATLETCISASQAKAILTPAETLAPLQAATWQWLATKPPNDLQRRIVTLGDADYPPLLLETADPPVMLYVMGQAQYFDGQGLLKAWPQQAIAMVGSRNPTPQGVSNARSFAKALHQHGWCIVSGLALGIDAAAHEGALEAQAGAATQPATIAVIGTGIDRVYPRRNHALAQSIALHGLIVSEYHLGTPPLAQNFPKRNRIISGLAQGTLVVEAAPESGSLVTARLASEQGRDVFAIPGSIHAPQSKGCHALIRQGAKLVESVNDILEEWPSFPPAPIPVTQAQTDEPPLEETTNPLLKALGFDPVDIETLSSRTGQSVAQLQTALLELELEGLVGRLPGGLFQQLRNA